jgi:DNA polymerase/3'-5' exonuclease PolX
MEYSAAKIQAQQLMDLLRPHCSRIEVAGSIRRQAYYVKDVEIVCIPKQEEIRDLFGQLTGTRSCSGFIKAVQTLERVKGDPVGKYTQRILPGGMKADIFLATPENWGLILAIRTGSAAFSRDVLAGGWVRKGYHGKDGMLHNRDGKPVIMREEEDLFRLIGIEWIHPIDRS